MAAIMLDDKQAYHHEGGDWHNQQAQPVADTQECVTGNPCTHKGHQCQYDFHNRLAVVGASIGCKFLDPGALGGSQNSILCKTDTTLGMICMSSV